jgi:hypothetical protein
VNLAARLEGVSAARSGVVVSSAVMCDPEVAEWARTQGARTQGAPTPGATDGLRIEPFTATVKGFEDEPLELWALTPATGAKEPGQNRMGQHE